MSDDVTRELLPSSDERTEVLPPGPPQADGAGGLPFDDDDEWPVRAPARGIRLAVPVAALVALLLLATGFWGGATLEKRHGNSSSSSLASSFASRFRAAAASGTTGTTSATGTTGAGSGFGGFGGPSTAAATGTVSVVDGSTLYVLTGDGALVKVTLDPSTAITRNAKAKPVALRPGDTVVVQGATASNGNVTATSVSAIAPGTSSGGRLGGGFGGAGAAASGGGG